MSERVPDGDRTSAAGEAGLRPGSRFRARVVDLNTEGAGVVRHGALVVFVRGAVPGDVVDARIERLRRGHAEGALIEVVEPAPSRRAPPCPHQPACGGCPLMVLDASAALALKAAHLREVLRRIGRIDHPPDRVVAAPAALRYRGRVRFAVAPRAAVDAPRAATGAPRAATDAPRAAADAERTKAAAAGAENGAPLFGFRPRGRDDALVPVDDCLLAPARASELARGLLARLAAATPPAGRPWPEQISLRGSLARGEWLAVLHGGPGPWPEAAGAARAAVEAEPDLVGVVRLIGRGGRAPAEYLLAGRPTVVEEIDGVPVELGATTFLQVNPGAAALLYREVRAALAAETPARRLLDLYCGVGLGALLAADAGVAVLGIEWNAASVELARRAAARAKRAGAEFRVADAVAAAADLVAAGERFDRIVVNPPREGTGPGLSRALRDLSPEVVVVVSCHPAALARDLSALVAEGFGVDRVVAVDMFPQTPHLEAVVRLRPRG